MPNMLGNAVNWLNTTLKTSAGDTIVYQRGSSTVSISAVVGASDGERMDSGGMSYAFVSTDFLIKSSDLVLAGEMVVPQRGDVITFGGNQYSVASLQSGEKPYRESGTASGVYRVHTKLSSES